MPGEIFGGRPGQADPPGEMPDNNESDSKLHEPRDPVADLIAQIKAAAERGDALAAGARVLVRKVGRDVYRVERGLGR